MKIDAPVTLVAAVAGWVKTPLAASWLEAGAADREAAGVSLDKNDEDPQMFWRAVATALMPVAGTHAEKLRRITAFDEPAENLPGTIVAGLRHPSRSVALVLDNLRDRLAAGSLGVAAVRRTPAASAVAAGHDASGPAVAAASPPPSGTGE